MAECSKCHTKIGFFSKTYWEVDEHDRRSPLCKDCRAKATAPLDAHRLSNGYTRLQINPFPGVLLEVPVNCVACGVQVTESNTGCEKDLHHSSTNMVGTEFITTTRSIPVVTCSRCEGLGLRPAQFIRVRPDPTGSGTEAIYLEIGNEEVAVLFEKLIRAQMKRAAKNCQDEMKKSVGFENFKYSGLYQIALDSGVRSSKRVKPGDKGWVRA